MRSRARSPRIPRKLLRGQKLMDGISGEEIYQRDPTTRYQRGMWMHKKNYDYLTTKQMEDMLQDTLTTSGISYQSGQGLEVPTPMTGDYGLSTFSYGSEQLYYGGTTNG